MDIETLMEKVHHSRISSVRDGVQQLFKLIIDDTTDARQLKEAIEHDLPSALIFCVSQTLPFLLLSTPSSLYKRHTYRLPMELAMNHLHRRQPIQKGTLET
ncbi:MAG: hypothetical protein ACQESG_02110 [Nanobdellota archaeon]